METTLLTGAKAKEVVERLVRECAHIDVVVAWAGNGDLVQMIANHGSKLRHVVIGTHLYQTHPFALRKLRHFPVARCMPPNGQLFHPKVYLFASGSAVSAIIGSHNLTKAAFDGGNIEASVLLKGSLDDAVLDDIANFTRDMWQTAKRISREFLTAYEKQYDANRAKQKALGKFISPSTSGQNEIDALSLSWKSYVGKLQNELGEHLSDRLQVIAGAAAIFAGGKKFKDMPLDERRAIAGTYARNEATLDNVSWGWFGNMSPQGDFKSLVKNKPEGLSLALENIPLTGPVTEAQYRNFARDFRLAFRGKTHHGGVPTATRLLVMKRPDFFVGVNYANKEALCQAYGVAHTTLSLDNYWERIVVPTHLSKWWREPRPASGPLRRLWSARAALLDCLYYRPRSLSYLGY